MAGLELGKPELQSGQPRNGFICANLPGDSQTRADHSLYACNQATARMNWNFNDPELLDRLEASDDATLDMAPFGIIAMAEDGAVTGYNATESRYAGLTSERVLGRHFFTNVAPCTNNFMVAQRFETEPALDAVIDYVFTFRMKPTKVKLRMLKQPNRRRMYLVVERI
jgi:photoactive yellow protein